MNKRKFKVTWDLLVLLVQKDLRVRYRGSVLGYSWSMLNPLLYMGILSLVFSFVMKFKVENYPIFILTGIVSWNLLHQSLMQGVHSIVSNGGLIRKVKLPISLFPTATVASVMVHFLLSLVAFFFVSIFLNFAVSWTWLLIPLILIPFAIFVWGLVMLVASVNVYFRDVGHTLDPLLQLVFYGTPIIYPAEVIPEKFRYLLLLNPVTHYVEAMRDILYRSVIPDMTTMMTICMLALVSAVMGMLTFKSLRGRFVYQL